ncbi:flagellar hook-basal body complex protein FliE [Desulfovibrio piger]|nr:flagellar hook-basal body complex protein FliE [Desulfovibrio piger]
MGVQSTGMKAYENAVQHFNAVESSLRQGMPVQYSRGTDRSLLRDSVDRSEDFGSHSDFMVRRETRHTAFGQDNSFSQTLSESLARVNDLQQAKAQAVEDFASGRNQNVHELMVTMQKSSLAMKLTTAVRGKVLEAYKELAKLQF